MELATLTGLSRPTVNKIVADLLVAGMVREAPFDPTRRRRGGPRPKLVVFRPDYAYVIGVDVGANKLLVLLSDLSGRIVASRRGVPQRPPSATHLLGQLQVVVRQVLEEAGVAPSSVVAVTVGTPGIKDPKSGRLSVVPQFPGWEEVDLVGSIQAWLPSRVLVETEVQLTLAAERQFGMGRGIDDVVYINVGIGVAAGILVQGHRYVGATGAAGEIGYLPILGDEAGDGAARSGFGAFEQAAGGLAYARLGAAAARGPDGACLLALADGNPDAVDAAVVFQAAGKGDSAATSIVELLTRRLARGIAAVVAVVDPALIVLGGGLSRAGEALRGRVERELAALHPRPPRLVLSELGDEAVALGAVTTAIATWEAVLEPPRIEHIAPHERDPGRPLHHLRSQVYP